MKRITTILFISLFLTSCEKNGFESMRFAQSDCIQNMIEEFLKQPKERRPYSVTEYLYKGNLVYYIISPCCDQYNPVYNDDCEYLGAPTGGARGAGDGKLPDFFSNVTNKKVIWER